MCGMCGQDTVAQAWGSISNGSLVVSWVLVAVPGDGVDIPPCAYTLGLSDYGHPEFITFGLPGPVATAALTPLAKAVTRGHFFDEGDNVAALYPPGAPPPQLLRFPDSAVHLIWGDHIHCRDDDTVPSALQVAWTSEPDDMPGLTLCVD